MVVAPPDPDTMNDLTPLEREALEGIACYRQWDSGYSKQQSTRPQTLGYGLVDSPVGQMACILEKFWRWAERRFTNIIHWSEPDRGGHFAAFEQPELFVNELRHCFRSVRS